MVMLKKVELPRRMCPVIFLLDTSSSMSWTPSMFDNLAGAANPIGAVNSAMENILPELSTMNEKNPDIEIQIAVMKFDFGAEWVSGSALVSPKDYVWRDLDATGPTSMGAAFRELNKKLTTKEGGFMKRASGSVAPVLFLLSDGEPTDDYSAGLQELQQNNWYKVAARVAIGYGDANDGILCEFTMNKETVLHTNNPTDLMKMIKFVTITSSMVASSGKSGGGDDNTGKVGEEMKTQTLSGGGALGENASTDEEW